MRTCIFCDGPVNSKEDAWPLWLVRNLGKSDAGIIEGQRGKQAPKSWRAGIYPLRTGNVCKSCNTGWMSNLENHAKPIIERFFLNQKTFLDQSDQTTLAIWACKNAMVYETLRHNQPSFFTPQERKSFRESFQLPPNTSIWLAKIVEFAGLFCSASDLSGHAVGSFNQVDAYVTTMGFGPIAMQILNSKFSKPIDPSMTITGDLRSEPWDEITIQIWPTSTNIVSWPGKVGLNGELGLDNLSHRWKSTK
jgi:hypothetical protein